jgi:hypothetical protein
MQIAEDRKGGKDIQISKGLVFYGGKIKRETVVPTRVISSSQLVIAPSKEKRMWAHISRVAR